MEAVVALDIKYPDFHKEIYERLKASGDEKACGNTYLCPDGVHTCETRYEMGEDWGEICESLLSL